MSVFLDLLLPSYTSHDSALLQITPIVAPCQKFPPVSSAPMPPLNAPRATVYTANFSKPLPNVLCKALVYCNRYFGIAFFNFG